MSGERLNTLAPEDPSESLSGWEKRKHVDRNTVPARNGTSRRRKLRQRLGIDKQGPLAMMVRLQTHQARRPSCNLNWAVDGCGAGRIEPQRNWLRTTGPDSARFCRRGVWSRRLLPRGFDAATVCSHRW